MAVSGTLTKTVNIIHTKDDSISTPTDTIASGAGSFPVLTTTITDGTAAGQVTKVYRKLGTLTAGASETIDLSGTLTDFHGDAVVFTGIKYILIAIVAPDGSKKLVVGNAASNSFQGPLSASGTQDCLYDLEWKNFSATGWAVTNSSTDNFKIANPGAGSVSYALMALGI